MTELPTTMAKAFIDAFAAKSDLVPGEDEHLLWVDDMNEVLSAIDPGLMDGTAVIIPTSENAELRQTVKEQFELIRDLQTQLAAFRDAAE